MDETERQSLLREISLLRNNLSAVTARANDDEKAKRIDNYIRQSRIYGDIPKDQFSHQHKILFHQTLEPRSRADLFQADMILGHIKDARTMIMFQKDFRILHRFFDMGMRSPAVAIFFNNLYYAWLGQLRMTSALGGTERWLQSFLEPTGMPYESFTFWEKQKAKKEAKKHGKLRDYLPFGRGGSGGGEGEGEGKTYG